VTLAPDRTAPTLLDIGPLAQLRAGRLVRRLAQLLAGLVAYGVSMAMMVRGDLGVMPWDVLHIGFVSHAPISLGQAVILFSCLVLLIWIPLREKPGIGTVANALLVGLSADATLALVERPDGLPARLVLMAGGILLCGFATAVYVGAQLGRGPRDGLMTGLARRTGLSLRLVRTGLEVLVIVLGVLLAGGLLDAGLGLGTLLYAVAIGPLAQALIPFFLVRLSPTAPATAR